jgi:ferritin-like metal-binding protein YciE
MALIDTLERRLQNYYDAETRILQEGATVEDEDQRKQIEANLREVRAGIESLEGQVQMLTSKVRKRKQYPVRLG